MQSAQEIRDLLMSKAEEDEGFRAKLLADPNGTIEQTCGITIPAGYSVQVHEESPTTAHLVLPLSGQLTAQELEQAAGGIDIEGSDTNDGVSDDW